MSKPTFNTGILIHNARDLGVEVIPVEANDNVLLRLGNHPDCITLADTPERLRSLLCRALEAVADTIADAEDEGPDLISHAVDYYIEDF